MPLSLGSGWCQVLAGLEGAAWVSASKAVRDAAQQSTARTDWPGKGTDRMRVDQLMLHIIYIRPLSMPGRLHTQ